MALKAVVEKLEDVAEPLREFYTKGSDGKFRLEAEGVEDVTALKSALTKERETNQATTRTLKDLQKQFEGLDPEKARDAQRRIQEIEDKQLLDEGKVEELITSRTERMRAEHASQVQAFQAKEAETAKKLTATTSRLEELLIDGALRDAGSKFGGLKGGADSSLILLARHGGIDGIRWELREGQPVPVQKDGTVKYGKDPALPMTPDEFVALAAEKAAYLFESSSGTGAQPTPGARPAGAHVLSADVAKNPAAYRAAKEAALKAGQSLQILEAR